MELEGPQLDLKAQQTSDATRGRLQLKSVETQRLELCGPILQRSVVPCTIPIVKLVAVGAIRTHISEVMSLVLYR